MAERLELKVLPNLCPETLTGVEEVIQTSVSHLFFRDEPRNVFKVLSNHNHPLIGLKAYTARFNALLGEMQKGDNTHGINRGNSIDPYQGICNVYAEETGPDCALKMVRFPDKQRMDKVLKRGDLSAETVQTAVGMIIDYHRSLEVTEDASQRGEANHFKARVMEPDLGLILHLIEGGGLFNGEGEAVALQIQVELLREREREFLDERVGDFTRAIELGMVKNAHGDTKLTNCFVSDGSIGRAGEVYFLDAIAFRDDWSCGDLRSEIAYFLLNFDFERTQEFNSWLKIVAEEYDNKLADANGSLLKQPLFWFYLNYRAWVEAKVALLEAGENSDRLNDAKKYLNMAEKYLHKAFDLAPELEWDKERVRDSSTGEVIFFS